MIRRDAIFWFADHCFVGESVIEQSWDEEILRHLPCLVLLTLLFVVIFFYDRDNLCQCKRQTSIYQYMQRGADEVAQADRNLQSTCVFSVTSYLDIISYLNI